MEQVNVLDAKTRLSALLARVEAGEEIVIARAGVPVAKLVPFPPEREPRVPGAWKDKISLPDNWEEIWVAMDDDVLEMFEEALGGDEPR